jgi:3-oxoacyl-[acyl-carrier protein] reductase
MDIHPNMPPRSVETVSQDGENHMPNITTNAGRIAFVTGAGRGFGRAFSEVLGTQGAHVMMVDIDGDVVEDAAAAIRARGGRATALTCDVADEASVAAAMAVVQRDHGGLDILINNAGLHSEKYNRTMANTGVAGLRRLFDVNVMGVVICTLAAAPLMVGRDGAAIVNISSTAAYPVPTAYGVSKLAVRGLTTAFARELGGRGVRVNAIAPGLIMTDTIRAELNPESVAYVQAQQVLAREGVIQDIVDTMLYLISPASSFMTGETLKVGGGFTLGLG